MDYKFLLLQLQNYVYWDTNISMTIGHLLKTKDKGYIKSLASSKLKGSTNNQFYFDSYTKVWFVSTVFNKALKKVLIGIAYPSF